MHHVLKAGFSSDVYVSLFTCSLPRHSKHVIFSE